MTHPREATARHRKARAIADALIRAGAKRADITDEQWALAASVAGVNLPSEATKAVVREMLKTDTEIGESVKRSAAYHRWWDAPDGKKAGVDFEEWRERHTSPPVRKRLAPLGPTDEYGTNTRFGPNPIADVVAAEVASDPPCEGCGKETEILGARLCFACREPPTQAYVAKTRGEVEHLTDPDDTDYTLDGLRADHRIGYQPRRPPCKRCIALAEAKDYRLPRTWTAEVA